MKNANKASQVGLHPKAHTTNVNRMCEDIQLESMVLPQLKQYIDTGLDIRLA